MMRTERLIPFLLIAAAVLTIDAAPASAAELIPFKGHFAGVLNPPHGPPPEILTGSGNASDLGHSTNRGYGVITPNPASCPGGFTARNDETLTSSDGDQITFTIHDENCPTSPGVFTALGAFVVTGGTGRFTGATGGGALTGSPDFNQGTFEFSFDGKVSRPKGG